METTPPLCGNDLHCVLRLWTFEKSEQIACDDRIWIHSQETSYCDSAVLPSTACIHVSCACCALGVLQVVHVVYFRVHICFVESVCVCYSLCMCLLHAEHYRCLTGSACFRVHICLIVCTCDVHTHAAHNSLYTQFWSFEVICNFSNSGPQSFCNGRPPRDGLSGLGPGTCAKMHTEWIT